MAKAPPREAVEGFTALLEPPVVEATAIVLDEKPSESRALDLRAMEDSLFEQATDIVNGVMRFADIDPENPPLEAPASWVEQYGAERAKRLFTVAKAGWMSKKEAPVGIAVAESVHRSITKARSTQGGPTVQLNAVFLTQNNYTYEELEISGDDDDR